MRLRLQESENFARIRVTPDLRLLEDRGAVTRNLEATLAGRDHLEACIGKVLSELGRQTGGPRLVVSDGAVLDGQNHRQKRNGDGLRTRTRLLCHVEDCAHVAPRKRLTGSEARRASKAQSACPRRRRTHPPVERPTHSGRFPDQRRSAGPRCRSAHRPPFGPRHTSKGRR